MAKQPREPKQIIDEIEKGAIRIGQLATEMSGRILWFEDWLSRLPGKVETRLYEYYEPDQFGRSFFALKLHRSGKRWIVSHASGFEPHSGEDYEPSWEPVSEATLETKVKSITLFPKLLDEILRAQIALTTRLSEAQVAFDAFASKLGEPRVGGK